MYKILILWDSLLEKEYRLLVKTTKGGLERYYPQYKYKFFPMWFYLGDYLNSRPYFFNKNIAWDQCVSDKKYTLIHQQSRIISVTKEYSES